MECAVFLDRDGTLGGDGWYCHPHAFTLFPEAIPAIKMLNDHNLKVLVITNQTHIGHGDITIEQVNASFKRIQQQLKVHGAHLDGWYVCPHTFRDDCQCRKPSPFMLLQAAKDFNVNLSCRRTSG